MESDEFESALEALIDFCARQRTAIMCDEAVWWRCHRALISDVLRARGIEVLHILGMQHAVSHPYTSAAQVVNGRISYRTSDIER